ncbi:MAG TPA: CvpA family protein [Burkholderiales bacterium]|nr:CvpA family protein [Burkholderiales bacterium]
MTWVDYTAFAIVAVSVLLGLWRGFLREAISVIGWILALWLAARFAPMAALWLPQDFTTPLVRQLIAAILIFIVVSLLAGLIGWLVAKLAHSIGLGLVDRGLGAIFGFGRGVMIVLVCAVLIGLTSLTRQQGWREAALRGPLETAAIALKPYLPQAIAARMRYE